MKISNKNIIKCVILVASFAATSNLNMHAIKRSIQHLVERVAANLKKHVVK